MLAHTHVVIGLAVGLYLKEFTQTLAPESTFIYYAVLLIASILPDIDHRGSTLNRTLTITKVIPWFFKHRGIFHSAWPLLIGATVLLFFVPVAGIAYFIGYTSHLLTDSLTKAGVNWLYPSNFKIRGPLHTGGIGETALFLFFTGLTVLKIIF